MLNIEIYGLGVIDGNLTIPASLIYHKICKGFSEESLDCNFVVTTGSSLAMDRRGQNQPFVRIFSNEPNYTEMIIEILQKIQKEEGIKFNIVVLPLERFIPSI
ncbi:MAG: hypothetical protein WC460_05980 [Patescibacteria group bacterium]